MSFDFPPELQRELLDDFFTECDEHLTNIRSSLVLLEPSINRAQPDRAVVDDLFREFHSFKGISAIVSLRAAEQVAHAAEDYLRELTRGLNVLSKEGLDLLMEAAHSLEKIVLAFRSHGEIPDVAKIQNDIRRLCSQQAPSPIKPPPTERTTSAPRKPSLIAALDDAVGRGLVLWKCTFTPDKELDARGVNINFMRARLCEHGEILQASPNVTPSGSIAFEFIVGMKETPADIAQWTADGTSVELLDHTSASSPALSAAAVAESRDNPFLAPSHLVRVDLKRLDELMRITGETMIHRSHLEELITRGARERKPVDATSLHDVNVCLTRSLRELREAIMKVRLVTVAEAFARMPFVVRDLARESSKKVRLELEGQQTEIDKYLIEQLKDPLLHLVRNAFSHGIETPAARIAAGKPEEGTILLKAWTVGDSVIMQVRDDGAGIDRGAVNARSATSFNGSQSSDDNDLLNIICAPGFSTRDDADMASGRGVGMAVVLTKIRELGGVLSVETEVGKGTQFTLRLPLTLAIAQTFIVSAGPQTCAVPQAFVQEVMEVTAADIRIVNGVEAIPYHGGVLPVTRLSSVYGATTSVSSRLCVLVLTSERGSSGLVVDRIHGQKEVVVRAMRDPFIRVPIVTGATELGDGRPVLILNPAAFTSGAVRPNEASAPAHNN